MSRSAAAEGTRRSDGHAMDEGTKRRTRAVLFALLAVAAGMPARGEPPGGRDFTSFNLEELMQVEITSVSKKPERLEDAPAAVYVISAEEIRRSGATSLPELLRMVPGLQVARTGSHTWEISARGFRYKMANKLLVLVDGRAVYSPIYGTVVWEDQDLPLEDVERIEVIRGPGATLWGTNAVNGVINVITKKAAETPGTLVRVHAGNEDRLGVLVRRGAALGPRAWGRLAAQAFREDDLVLGCGRPAGDRWSGAVVTGRLDWEDRTGAEWSLEAQHRDHDRHQRTLRPLLTPPFVLTEVQDFDSVQDWALVTWHRAGRGGGHWTARAWYERGESRIDPVDVRRGTVDGLLEYAGARNGRHRWFWGLGARDSSYRTRGVPGIYGFAPSRQSDQIYSGYVQDDIRLGDGRAHLVLGAKGEYTSASGMEFQPQARVRWRFSPAFMAWAAVSRAARTPAYVERAIDWLVAVSPYELPDGTLLPVAYRLRGSPGVRAEHQVAHEAGLRWTLREDLSLDLAGFSTDYRGVTSFRVGAPSYQGTPLPHADVVATYANESRLRFRGLDLIVRWTPRDDLRFEAWWSWIEERIVSSPYDDPNLAAYERGMYLGVNPRHQLHLRAGVDCRGGWELDGSIHWTDRLATGPVPSWTRVDLRVGWHSPDRDREWSLALRNALGRHLEFRYAIDAIEPEPAWVEPALVSRWTWRF